MPYELICETTLDAAPEEVWAVWSDLGSYPSWDPREEVNDPHGPLAPGTTGDFRQKGRGAGTYTITAVEPGRTWTSETGLPGGRLEIRHDVEPVAGGTRLVKTYRVFGPMALAFRLFFARGIRAEMPETFAALGAEVSRRAAAA